MDTIINYNTVYKVYNQQENSAARDSFEDSKIIQDREIKRMQQQEFLEAKLLDEEKKRLDMELELKRFKDEEQAKLEAARKQKEKEKLKASIPEEPEENKEGVAEIAFRFSSGRRVVRRFPKDCIIQVN